MAWLAFVLVFDEKKTVNGTQPRLVHPELPWDEQVEDGIPNVLLLMHYMPTKLTNAISINQHPASAKRSDGTLISTCWELVRQSVGVLAYEKYCIKLNYSPYAFDYNGSQTDIYSEKDSMEIMDKYFDFLMVVFSKLDKVHLCSVAVKNQVISMFGGETNFNRYLQTCPGKFYSASAEKYITCCHPEALLNKKYLNEHTPGYASTWDKMYSDVRYDLGVSFKCDLAENIINQVKGSVSFELMVLAAKEKNERNSERLLTLSALGQHPWQQPNFIERNRKRQLDLSANGVHNFQREDVIEQNSLHHSKRELENWSNNRHNFQQGTHWRHSKAMKTGEKGEWTDEEDSKLTMLVGKYGRKWIQIQKEMPGECSCPYVGLCF